MSCPFYGEMQSYSQTQNGILTLNYNVNFQLKEKKYLARLIGGFYLIHLELASSENWE